jgi:hypothetical protein
MGDIYERCIRAIIRYANADILVLAYRNEFAKKLDKIIGKCGHHRVIYKTESDENDCDEIISEICTTRV